MHNYFISRPFFFLVDKKWQMNHEYGLTNNLIRRSANKTLNDWEMR